MHIFSQLPYPDNYKAFQQRRGQSLKPLEAPKRLPALPSGLHTGQLPSLAELNAAVAAAFSGRQAAEVKPVMCHADPIINSDKPSVIQQVLHAACCSVSNS